MASKRRLFEHRLAVITELLGYPTYTPDGQVDLRIHLECMSPEPGDNRWQFVIRQADNNREHASFPRNAHYKTNHFDYFSAGFIEALEMVKQWENQGASKL